MKRAVDDGSVWTMGPVQMTFRAAVADEAVFLEGGDVETIQVRRHRVLATAHQVTIVETSTLPGGGQTPELLVAGRVLEGETGGEGPVIENETIRRWPSSSRWP